MATPLSPVLREAVKGRVHDADHVLAEWHAAFDDPTTRTASLIAAPKVSRALRRAGAHGAAVEVCATADPHITGPELRATLAQSWLTARMALGDEPSYEEVIHGARLLIEVSDTRFDKEEHDGAARLLHLAWELLLDRSLHTETTSSPLASDARAWTASVREAKVTRWLAAARPVRPRWRRPSPRQVRRVLLVTKAGSHFLDQPRAMAARAGVELREVVLTDLNGDGWLLPSGTALPQVRVAARTGTPPEVPAALAEAYAWADQVVVDWCDDAAVLVSATLPPGPELVVRVHSVEALSVQPHFVSWERVDRLLFVCGHIATLLTTLVPPAAKPRQTVLPPEAPERPLDGPVPAVGPEHVLAVVGWAQPVKDPVWALDVLAALRRTDPRWRLLLVGRDQFAEPSGRPALDRYADTYRERLAQPDVAGAVDHLPWLDDVTDLGAHASVILSSSVREGFAVGLHEAVEGGLLPVVRRWPLVAPFGAPGETCAPEWVVDTPEEAARRVLDADPDARARAWRWLDQHLGARVVEQGYRKALRWPVPDRRT